MKIPGTYQIPTENQEGWHKARLDFEAMEFSAKGRKLDLDELTGADLSAAELDILERIIEEPEE